MELPSSNKVGRLASALTALSIVSPISGLALEILIAWRFGTSPIVDAYRIGLLVGLFGWQVFIVQLLPHIIVPIFAEYKERGDEAAAWRITFAIANLLLIPASALSFWMYFRPAATLSFLGPGLTGTSAIIAKEFIRWFALTLAPFVWCGAAAGALYSQEIFWIPTASSSIGNLTLVALLVVSPGTTNALIVGTLLASLETLVFHVLRLWPLVRAFGLKTFIVFDPFHPGVRKALKLALPLLGTIGLQEWWAIMINRNLSRLPPGSLSSFGYAWKMGQIVSIAPASLALVLFPRFARSWQVLKGEGLVRSSVKAFRMALYLAIPIAVMCFVFQKPLLTLAFERGAFSDLAGIQTSRIFGLLILGAPAAVLLDYVQKMFYASYRMWLPTWVLLGSVITLTLVAPTLAGRSGTDGVAILAASLPCLQLTLLMFVLSKLEQSFRPVVLVAYGVGIAVIASACAGLGVFTEQLVGVPLGPTEFTLGVSAISGIFVGLAGFAISTLALRLPEAFQSARLLWPNCVLLSKVIPTVLP